MEKSGCHFADRAAGKKARSAVVVLGKNWRRSPFGLSMESRMNALAAGQLAADGGADLLIISGGMTAGRDRPSEAREMYVYMRRYFGPNRIPEDMVVLEEESIDTSANAELVRDVLGRFGVQDVVLVTTDAHVRNARRLFVNHGIVVRAAYASEGVVERRSHVHAAFARRYKRSCRAGIERAKETVRTGLLQLDPHGKLLRPITTIVRRCSKRSWYA